MRSVCPNEFDSQFGRRRDLRGQEVTRDEGGASSAAGLAMHVDAFGVFRLLQMLGDEIDAVSQLVLIRRLENVHGRQLKELDALGVPLVGQVGEELQLVSLVHGDDGGDALVFNELLRHLASKGESAEDDSRVGDLVPPLPVARDALEEDVEGQRG